MSKFAVKVTTALLALAVATGCSTLAAAQRASDTSYDQAEKSRGNAIVSRPVDTSYDQAEKNRANGFASRPATTGAPNRDWSYSHGR